MTNYIHSTRYYNKKFGEILECSINLVSILHSPSVKKTFFIFFLFYLECLLIDGTTKILMSDYQFKEIRTLFEGLLIDGHIIEFFMNDYQATSFKEICDYWRAYLPMVF
jgi:hypothetical protein